MDSEEHGESSSSPNGKLQISNIENWGTAGEVLKICLSDGSLFFVDSADIASDQVHIGTVISENQLQFLISEDEYIRARQKALSLLEYAENSTFLLRQKLFQRGFGKVAVERALEKIESAGYVDDRRFAETWVRSRIKSRPSGPAVLVGHLRKRGIPREIAEDAVGKVLAETDISVLLRQAAEKLKVKKQMAPEQLKNRLLRLGFPFSEIREYLEDLPGDEFR